MEIDSMLKKIEELREQMHRLTERKGTMLDKEVLEMSQEIDELLNKYSKALKDQDR